VEVVMPADSLAVTVAVLGLFAFFAVVLVIADLTWDAKPPSRARR
jgi:hypothetical protein